MHFVFFVGTAGSGKSSLVGAFQEWLGDNGIESLVVNLDPGAERLPYVPDIDIREWVSLDEVMGEYSLGPNGAQIVAADLMAVNINKVTDLLNEYSAEYVLVDTPGQLELFAFRESSRATVSALGKDRSMLIYLSDPTLYRSANGFVSSLTLSTLVQFRMGIPMLNILSKSDTLTEEQSSRILDWFNNPDTLYGDLLDEDSDPTSPMAMELFRAMEDSGVFGEMRSASAADGSGLEEIYGAVQLQFAGGEDAEHEI